MNCQMHNVIPNCIAIWILLHICFHTNVEGIAWHAILHSRDGHVYIGSFYIGCGTAGSAEIVWWYMRPLNTTRDQDGEFVSLVLPIWSLDEERHFQYFRMSAPKFDDLLSRVIRYLPDSHQNRPLSGSSWQIIFCQMLACFPTSTMCYDWVCALTNKCIYIGHLEAWLLIY